jgi:MFS transporter, ACS family, hexuronate transporter
MTSAPGFVGRYRWVIGLLLFFATTINYIDRQIPALRKPTAADNVTAGYTMVFAFCGSACLLAFAVSHLLAPRFALVRMRDTF